MAGYVDQDSFLTGKRLIYKRFTATPDSDHEHCNLCGAKFSERGVRDLSHGYATPDDIAWICSECFMYYHDRYGWKADNPEADASRAECRHDTIEESH